MAKQTIESKILAALGRVTVSPGETVDLGAVWVQHNTKGLTIDQVHRFGQRMGRRRCCGRNIRYVNGSFRLTIPEPAPPPRPAAPVPDWYAPLAGEAVERARSHMWSTMDHKKTASQVVHGLRNGDFALPPWQRGSVWTEDQRVALLDSIMRGASIGAITLWSPGNDVDTERVPFGGCPVGDHARMVVDGQQRLTTILMAATGQLDHWRWNGREWTTGRGFMLPSMIEGLGPVQRQWHQWARADGRQVAKEMYRAIDTIERYDLTLMSIEGSVDHMVEVYRRLATFGSPHSMEDLAHMERWQSTRG